MSDRSDATYHDLIAANRRNSVLLVAGFVLFVGLLAAVLAAAFLGGDPAAGITAGVLALVVAGLMAVWSYYGGGNAILRMSGARLIEKKDDPQLYNVVDEMAIAAGVRSPPVYLIDDTALNAFATGRDPDHAALAITKGLRERLTRSELQAVIAHEMSHVRHFDIRLAMLLATLVGMVVLLTDFFRRGLFWTGGGRRNSGRDGGGPAALVILVVAILLSILAPLIARIIQLAASRPRGSGGRQSRHRPPLHRAADQEIRGAGPGDVLYSPTARGPYSAPGSAAPLIALLIAVRGVRHRSARSTPDNSRVWPIYRFATV